MKKQLLSLGLSLIAMLSVTVSFAAGKSVKSSFTSTDVKHYQLAKGSIVIDGNKTSVFNQNGKWIYSISRFSADNLPKNVMDIVRNDYGQFYVSGIEKVDQRGLDAVYIVHLQDNTSLKTVKVNMNDGETELLQDLVKG